MYKKITHTIFEEQFAHPDIAKNIPVAKTDIKSTITDNTLVNTLRRQVRDVLVHYAGRMRDTVLSIANGTADRTLAAQLAVSEGDKLAEIFGRYFPVTDTATFSREFSIMTSTAIEMAQAEQSNTDASEFSTQNTYSIEALADIIMSSMSGVWFKDDVVAVLTEITNNWVGQIRARKNGDWSTDFRLAGRNESYLVSGTPLSVSVADALTNSIAMTFPEQF